MKRVVAIVISLGVLLGALLVNALFWNIGSEGDDTESSRFTDYRVDFKVDKDGDIHVTQKLTLDGLFTKHGIFEFFDRADPTAPGTRRTPYDISVTRDGEDEPFEELHEEHGRFTNLKIGSPDKTLGLGEHSYVIKYSMHDALQPGENVDGDTQFYWQLIPSGWQQDIDQATLTVHLPAPSSDEVQCAVGVGETDGCEVEGAGTDTLKVTSGPIEDHTPISIKTGLDLPTPAQDKDVPWTARWDRTLGTSPVLLGVVILFGLAAAILGAVLAWMTYERNPQFPLMYGPPDGIGPAQAKYILTEGIDREAYVATLMHAAQHGAIDLQKGQDSWTITDKGGPEGWRGLDEVSSGVAHLLSGPGSSFTAGKKDVSAGERLKEEIATFETSTKAWALTSGNLTQAGPGGLGGLLVLACIAGAGAIAIWNPLNMTMVGFIPGAFAIMGAPMLKTGASTKRTRTGRELWSRAGGFKRVLSTPSSQDRFDFSGRQELYTAYIPWAVAFGCAEEWASKYRTETGTEPPVPSYFGSAYVGASAGSYVDSMVGDFNDTVSSAISSYNATQSSSSSGGGGGFSGGGGGGGGGGGSW
jgi:hypothetical protein